MAIYRGPGGTGDSAATPGSDASVASTAAANAAASAIAAASSASSAGTDAGTAQNAANNAANSQTAAGASATSAAASASASSTSAAAALASQIAAALSESNTASLYDSFDDRYLGVKTTSPATDNDGNTLQTGALYFNSTTNDMYVWTGSLWTTVSNTTTSTNAATSAAAALTSQNAASTSASNAATSATNASNSASTASTQATNAANSASAASTSASNASSSASSASTSASTATTQASNASTSATNAATSATSASGSASTATTQAGIATTQATNAATSATNAANSYDEFDDRYLGSKSSAPTVDNDGNTLLTGAIYWSTSTSSLWIWDGSSWLPAAFSSAGNVTSFNTRTGAITLTSGDVTTALTYTPLAPSTIGSTVQAYDADLTAIAALSPTADNFIVGNGSVWTLETPSQARTSLGLGTIATQDSNNVSITGGSIAVSANPSASLDVATKQYVDAAVTNLHIHDAVKAATTAALSGTVTYNNGTSGVGATLTLGTALTILDGYTLVNGDRILIKNQASALQNGVYTWATGGTVLTRGTGSDELVELNGGDFFFVVHGTVNGDTGWVIIDPVTTIGTSAINFTQFSGAGTYTAGTGLTLTGSQFTVDSTSYSNWNTAYTDRNKWDGGATGLTAATGRTSLGATTLGSNLFTITNPSAITFPRFNADNTVSSLDAATFRTAIGAGTSSTTGTVTSASVVSANGFAGTVATATTTPAITLTTSITGVLKGNGTAISAATAGTDYGAPATASTWSASQRGTVTTDNDLSFDMSVTNNFKCTPTALGTLTFTNITSGQSGWVLLVNTSGFAVSAAATTKVSSAALTTISTAGTYLLSYFSDGTNVYVTYSGAMA
jgi:hypothetical protein